MVRGGGSGDCERAGYFPGDGKCARRSADGVLGGASIAAGARDSDLSWRILPLAFGVSETRIRACSRESLIKDPGSSVHPCVPCGSRFSMVLNQSFTGIGCETRIRACLQACRKRTSIKRLYRLLKKAECMKRYEG